MNRSIINSITEVAIAAMFRNILRRGVTLRLRKGRQCDLLSGVPLSVQMLPQTGRLMSHAG